MSSRSDRVVQVFEAAVVLEPGERQAFVRDTCADDPEVCRQVEAMLADSERSVVIDRPVGEAVGQLFDDEPMVAAGTRFGPYQVESLLGAGGMGEVYRATDTVLGRQVAIKILPADVSRDPERTARFRREAKILASLNHSNIGAIYGVEAAEQSPESPLGLVLELIEGPTLADRLRAGALPLDEALAAARQVAEALDAAHQQGVVHRDLKPGNIKVRDDGIVKVLDFGLARVDQTAPDSSSGRLLADSPTITTPAMTAAGVLLGTAAYMSPEQAKGRPADKRSDIWAFGCVLYEMLTGSRAFGGDDVADTLAAVLRGEPDYTLLPRDTPEAIRALLRGCLTKDRHRRIGDVSAVRFVLDNIAVLGRSGEPVVSSPPHRGFSRRRVAFLAVAGLVLAVAGGATARYLSRPGAANVTEYDITPTGAAALFIDAVSRDLTVLPDGSLVYKGFGRGGSAAELFLRRRGRVEPTPLMTGGSPRAPFSSPDGRQIGFVDVGSGLAQLKTMPLAGGPPVLLAALDGPSAGITWGDDDSIVFATSVADTGLQRVRSGAQGTEVLTRPDAARGEGDHLWPHYLPGARAVLFTVIPAVGATEPSDISVLDLRTNKQTRLKLRGASHAHYTSSGHVVYLAGSTMFAVPFDVGSLTVQGTPTALPYQVLTIASGAAEFDIGRDGTMAYVPAGAVANAPRTLTLVDRAGRETPIKATEHEYMQPRLSPDNSKLAVHISDTEGDVYIWDFALETLTPITHEAGMQLAPIWMGDRHIVYTSMATGTPSSTGGLMRRAVDGTGDPEPLLKQPGPAMLPNSTFGTTLLASTLLVASDVLQLTLQDGGVGTWWQTPFFERNAEISPDGRWVAYEASNPAQTLQYNIWIRPLANQNSAQWQVTTGGGRQPVWSRDGRELFYVGPDGAVYSVQIDSGGATPNPRSPRQVVAARYYHGIIGGAYAARMFDVSKDGRFLMIKDALPDRSAANASIRMRHDWMEELKRLVPSN